MSETAELDAVTVRLPKPLRQKIDALAKGEDRAFAWMARRLLAKAVGGEGPQSAMPMIDDD